MNDFADSCSSCERDHSSERPVVWSPAFAVWLCVFCLATRTDAELGATRTANAAAAMRGDPS